MTNGHEGLKGSFTFYRITREELRIYVFRCIRIRTESLLRRNEEMEQKLKCLEIIEKTEGRKLGNLIFAAQYLSLNFKFKKSKGI